MTWGANSNVGDQGAMIGGIDDLRRRGIVIVALSGWAVVIATAVFALPQGTEGLLAIFVSALLNCIPTGLMLKRRSDATARLVIGGVVAALPLLMLFVLRGSPLQTDASLFLIVALAALTLLWDTRPIWVACALIVAHHAVLIVFAPRLVFEGDGGTELVFIHALAVLASGTLLGWITVRFTKLLTNVEEARHLSEAQAEELKSATQSLENTLDELRAEQASNARAREEMAEVRKAAYEKVAEEFELSVSAVTRAVAETARMLERSARSLRIIASEAGREAQGVAGSALSASKAAGTVAAGIAEISLSISEIAANVGQQSELTSHATQRSGGGGKAIGSLSQQSQTIGEATRAIVRIAERTNLLSLNAAIEAASAGPAGRGFTIVAQEVKALAMQASEAATEIEEFLKGVRSGTVEAERSFQAIDAAIAELNKAANSIRYDVENQRQSADTIEEFARNAAGEADTMAQRTKVLSERAGAAHELSGELETAAAALAENIRQLEDSTDSFMTSLRSR